MKRPQSAPPAITRPANLAARALLASLLLALSLRAQGTRTEPGLSAHEWGTFTSVAGETGKAVEWCPWTAPADLPGFVEHLRLLDLKRTLSGTIRMETPVLYFYSARPTTVSVRVRFLQGLLTEWYPHASGDAPPGLANVSLSDTSSGGSLAWDAVSIQPGDRTPFAKETRGGRYYAARATGASPLWVRGPRGTQSEKFLFYRGVSSADPPVRARFLPGGQLAVANLAGEPVARLYLYERRGNAVGFRSLDALEREAVLSPPALDGSAAELAAELTRTLVAQGLYPDEARAMLETWKDSWFEEGARLLYVVPARFVERVLPLSIAPAPGETKRVFVGRLELVSAKTRSDVETALATGDGATLAKYDRFLTAILSVLAAEESDPVKLARIRKRLEQPVPQAAARLSK